MFGWMSNLRFDNWEILWINDKPTLEYYVYLFVSVVRKIRKIIIFIAF